MGARRRNVVCTRAREYEWGHGNGLTSVETSAWRRSGGRARLTTDDNVGGSQRDQHFSKYPPEPRDCWNRPTWWKKIKSIFFFEPREKSLARAVLAMGVDESRRFGGSSRSHAHPLRLLGRVQVPTHHAQSLSVSPDRDTRTKRARSPHRSLVIFKERVGTAARGSAPQRPVIIARRARSSARDDERITQDRIGPRERPDPRRDPP